MLLRVETLEALPRTGIFYPRPPPNLRPTPQISAMVDLFSCHALFGRGPPEFTDTPKLIVLEIALLSE